MCTNLHARTLNLSCHLCVQDVLDNAHIETVNYSSILCKLFCTSCEFCANYYCTIFTLQEYVTRYTLLFIHPMKYLESDV